MMNVLHVFKTYFPDTNGGIEQAIRQICYNQKDLGIVSRIYSLTAFSTSVLNRCEASVWRERRWFKSSSCDVGYPNSLISFKQQTLWADIVHFHFPWPFADILNLFSSSNKPTVVTYHSDIVNQLKLLKLYSPLMHWFLRSVDVLVATSPHYAATSNVLRRYYEKLQIIPLGINPESYPVPDDLLQSRIQKLYGNDFFLFVGVLRYYKGLHVLLDAVKDMPYKLVIAGDGPKKNELKSQAKRLELKNVTFLGQVSDEEKIALLKSCKAVVFPSNLRTEAFGVGLLEGAMYSKPLITTEIDTGTSYINKHKKTGLIVLPNNVLLLRDAMLKLHTSSALCEEYGNHAYERFKTNFTGKLLGERYCKLYLDIKKGKYKK